MEAALTIRPSEDNLWKVAVDSVGDELKSQIDFKQDSKTDTLGELLSVTEKAKKSLADQAWSFKRSSGQRVIVRDVLGKVAKWVNLIKDVGDFAVQFDPGHAGVAWAGIRFMLTVAVGDLESYKGMFETTADVAEYICRTAVLESLVKGNSSPAADELSRAIVKLYIAILDYLSKATAYCNQNTFKRILKYGVLVSDDLQSSFAAVGLAQDIVSRCALVMNLEAQLESQAELRRIRESFNAPMQRWDGALYVIRDELEAGKRQKILQWVSTEPYIQHHKHTKSEVLKGTGKWLLENPSFLKWKDESASSILWIRGIPGSGKSKLMSIAVEDALDASQKKESPEPVYFYCSRNPAEPGRSDPSQILASIARQLATPEVGGAILEPALEVYNEREAEGFAGGPLSLEESKDLIIKLLDRYKDATVTIAVDGLDECDDETRGDLLDAFEFLLDESPCLLKLLVSSRDDQDIVYQLENYPSLVLSSNYSTSDIELLVASEVKKIVNNRFLRKSQSGKEALSAKIIQELTTKADGMFRWVSLQLQALQKCRSEEAIMERLGKLPRTLGELYQELVTKMESFEAIADRDLAKSSLSWLLCSHARLTSAAFLDAVSTKKDGNNESISRDQLLDLCCNLVAYDDALDAFRFAHLSVREFLENHDSFRPELINARVSEACLIRITEVTPETDMEDEADPSVEALWYSYIYWAYHTQAAAKERTAILDELLVEFLSDEDDSSSCFGLWDHYLRQGILYNKWLADLPAQLWWAKSEMPSILLPICAFDISGVISPQEWDRLASKKITNDAGQTPIEVALVSGSSNIIKWMFDNDIAIPMTSHLLSTLAWSSHGETMVKLFLDKQGSDFPITDEFIVNITSNEVCGYEVMKLLLDTREAEISITAEVVETAVASRGSTKWALKLLKLILDKAGDNIVVTEHTIGIAARDSERGDQVLQMLIKKFGVQIPVSQQILLDAVRNAECGDKLMALFLKHFKERIEITDEIVQAAATNNVETFSLLLSEGGPAAQVVNDYLESAAGFNTASLAFLLDKYPDEIKISEATVEAAARNHSSMKLLLEKCGEEFQVTSDIVEIAATHSPECLDILLKSRPSEAKLTARVIVTSIEYNIEVFSFLLDEYRAQIQITEEIVKAATQYSVDALGILFDKCGDEIMVTEDILIAAASATMTQMSLCDSESIFFKFIMDKEADTKAYITQQVCLMSAGCGDVLGLEYLCQQIPAAEINPEWDGICRLYNAVNRGDLECVERLIKEPIPLDTKDYRGHTPLHIAACCRHSDIVKLLVQDQRVNVNSLSIDGRSPLFDPCRYGYSHIVEILLAAGAQADFIDVDGNTALSMARDMGQDHIIELLEGKA